MKLVEFIIVAMQNGNNFITINSLMYFGVHVIILDYIFAFVKNYLIE